MGMAQSASTLGDLKSTCNCQSCHKVVIGNCNNVSYTRKEHELGETTKRHSLDFVGIYSTKCCDSDTVGLGNG